MMNDITNYKIIGLVKGNKFSNSQHADIHPLGYMVDFLNLIPFNEDEKYELFPPTGKIFAFNFKNSRTEYLNKFIFLNIEEDIYYNEVESGKYKYRLDFNYQIALFGTTVINDNDFPLTDDGENNWNIISQKGYDKEDCYIESNGNLYKIFLREKNIDYIECWEMSHDFFRKNEDSIFSIENQKVIWGEIKGEKKYVDIITNQKLPGFLKSTIKKRYPEFLELLSTQKNWEAMLSENFNNKLIPSIIITKRFEKIRKNLHTLLLSKEELDRLYNDKRFEEVIETSINQLEDQYLLIIEKKNKAKIKEQKDKTEKEINKIKEEQRVVKAALDIQIDELTDKRQQLEKKINQLEATNEEERKKYEHLLKIVQENKQHLIEDFTIIKEVLSGTEKKQVETLQDFYIMEEILPQKSDSAVIGISEWQQRLEYFLAQSVDKNISYKLFTEFVAKNKIILVPDINLVLPLLKSINNVKYIVQSVGIDWKNFSSLWLNGLEALWSSCRTNPTILHFLILQNMNLSYIPCYMQPLSDLLSGLRTRLPYSDAGIGFPDNLRIIGTTISGSGGLPIYEKDICQYGCLPYFESERKKDKQIELSEMLDKKYVTIELIHELAGKCDPESKSEYYVSGE